MRWRLSVMVRGATRPILARARVVTTKEEIRVEIGTVGIGARDIKTKKRNVFVAITKVVRARETV
jgi:hypothetical protein